MNLNPLLFASQHKVDNTTATKGRLTKYAEYTKAPIENVQQHQSANQWDKVERRSGKDRRSKDLVNNKRLDSRAKKDRRSSAISIEI